MKHIVKDDTQWHKLRKTCITASEAACLVGVNPYSSANKMRQEKLNSTFTGNAFTRVGQVLEPVVVEITNEVMGTNFRLYEDVYENKVFFIEGPLGATPDAVDKEVLLECKTTRPHTYLKYNACPPLTYLIQLQVQMHCTGKKKGVLAILSTDLTQKSPKLEWPITLYEVLHNQIICDTLIKEAERFNKDEKFRVNSAIKKLTKLQLSMCYRRIHD